MRPFFLFKARLKMYFFRLVTIVTFCLLASVFVYTCAGIITQNIFPNNPVIGYSVGGLYLIGLAIRYEMLRGAHNKTRSAYEQSPLHFSLEEASSAYQDEYIQISGYLLESNYEDVCKRTGIDPKSMAVFFRESDVIGAGNTGGLNTGIVSVTTQLVNHASSGELQAVVAHELAHALHRDSHFWLFLDTFYDFRILGITMFIWQIFLLGLIPSILITFMWYVLPPLLIAKQSKMNETAADVFAVSLGLGTELASALEKIKLQNHKNNDEADNGGGLLDTHPHMDQRITYVKRLTSSYHPS